MVLATRLLENAFLKDVLNEITIFGLPWTSSNHLGIGSKQDFGFKYVNKLQPRLKLEKLIKKSHASSEGNGPGDSGGAL